MKNFRLIVGIILTHSIAPIFAVESTKEVTGQENPEVVKLLEQSHLGKTYFESLPRDIRLAFLQYYYSSGAALQDAIWKDKVDVVKDILSKGLNKPNIILPEKTYSKSVEMTIRFLGRTQKQIGTIDYKSSNQTPLMFAAMLPRVDIVKYLLETFPDGADYQNSQGKTALMYAIQRFSQEPDREEVIQLLLDNMSIGAPEVGINAIDKEGNTALHYAVQYTQNSQLTKKLLDYGAEPNVMNKRWYTALDLARTFEFFPMLGELLESHGAKTWEQLAEEKALEGQAQ